MHQFSLELPLESHNSLDCQFIWHGASRWLGLLRIILLPNFSITPWISVDYFATIERWHRYLLKQKLWKMELPGSGQHDGGALVNWQCLMWGIDNHLMATTFVFEHNTCTSLINSSEIYNAGIRDFWGMHSRSHVVALPTSFRIYGYVKHHSFKSGISLCHLFQGLFIIFSIVPSCICQIVLSQLLKQYIFNKLSWESITVRQLTNKQCSMTAFVLSRVCWLQNKTSQGRSSQTPYSIPLPKCWCTCPVGGSPVFLSSFHVLRVAG